MSKLFNKMLKWWDTFKIFLKDVEKLSLKFKEVNHICYLFYKVTSVN